jgi:polyisoprenoid-binding protein YceI
MIAAVLPMAVLGAIAATGAVDAGTNRLGFVARQSELDLRGSFRRFSADVDLDPGRLQQGRVRVTIDPASVDAGSGDADSLLRSAAFFDVERFPQAAFESTSIVAGEGGGFLARGPLTMKGHRATVVVAFTARRDAAGVRYEGATRISRLAFGIGEGQWSDTSTLDDDVLIEFTLHVAP